MDEKEVSQIAVEGFELSKAKTLFDKDLHVMGKEDFDKLSLPVMARNHLENGISDNLWYEEVVPYKSIFCFDRRSEGASASNNAEINKKRVTVYRTLFGKG